MSFDVKVLNDHLDVIKIDYQAQTVTLNGKVQLIMEFTAKIVFTKLEIIRKYRGYLHYSDFGTWKRSGYPKLT